MQRLDNVPSIPKPCSPEEGKLLEAGGEMTKTLIHAMFHNRTKRISQRDFALGLNQILWDSRRVQEIIWDQGLREKIYRNIDGWLTRALEEWIKKWSDIKPFLNLLTKEGRISQEDSALSFFIATYESGLSNQTINAWHNNVLWTNLQADTPVIYDGKNTTYYDAYMQFIKWMTESQLVELKKRCGI